MKSILIYQIIDTARKSIFKCLTSFFYSIEDKNNSNNYETVQPWYNKKVYISVVISTSLDNVITSMQSLESRRICSANAFKIA